MELLKAVVDNNRKNVKKLEQYNGLQSSAFVSQSEIEPDYLPFPNMNLVSSGFVCRVYLDMTGQWGDPVPGQSLRCHDSRARVSD